MIPKWPAFGPMVYDGERLSWDHAGHHIVAYIEYDPDTGSPDKESDGFWPSLDPTNAGYIGKKSKLRLGLLTWEAKKVLEAWENDEWFYCGVCIMIYDANYNEVTNEYSYAVWGCEANYPVFLRKSKRWHPNDHLTEMAHDLVCQALKAHNIPGP